MKIIKNSIIPFRGFLCINLFGILFTRKDAHRISPVVINHEMIHNYQLLEVVLAFLPIWIIAVALWLSPWFLLCISLSFYIWYVIEWLFRLLWCLFTLYKVKDGKYQAHWHKAYSNILFEVEAKRFETDFSYLHNRRIFAWLIITKVY